MVLNHLYVFMHDFIEECVIQQIIICWVPHIFNLLWILLLLLVENCILIHFLLAINNTNNTAFAMAVWRVTWFTQSQTKFHSFAILRTQCSSAHDSRSLKRKHWDRQSASDSVCSCWLCSCLRRRTVTPCLWKGQCLQEVFVVDEFHK